LSEAFNSNAFNVIVGLLVPGAILVSPVRQESVVRGRVLCRSSQLRPLPWLSGDAGLDRRAGSIIIVGYLVFAVCLRAYRT